MLYIMSVQKSVFEQKRTEPEKQNQKQNINIYNIIKHVIVRQLTLSNKNQYVDLFNYNASLYFAVFVPNETNI